MKKYVCLQFNEATQNNFREFCHENNLDLTTSFSGAKQTETEFDFHITVWFSTNEPTRPLYNGDIIIPPIKTFIKPIGYDVFGENKNCLVLKLYKSKSLLEIRDYYFRNYGLVDKFPEYAPHVTLTYAYNGNIPTSLPDFPLLVDRIQIKDIVN